MAVEIKNFNIDNYTDNFIKNNYTCNYHKNHWEIFRQRNLNCARIFYEHFKFESVIDFGCSIGTYLEYFHNHGCFVLGVEYCLEECQEYIDKIGLSNNISYGDVSLLIDSFCWRGALKYDCSMSIEVAEHIPTERSDNLVDNLCNSTRDIIIFTAAKPGQGGTGHINCQPQNFWVEKFESRGFHRCIQDEIKIKSKMIPQKDVGDNSFPNVWSFVYDNLMIFKKKSA